MDKKDIIKQLEPFFSIEELVCKHTYDKYGSGISWQFLQKDFLYSLLIIRRDILRVPMTCNTWHSGGNRDESGLRCNICDITKGKTLKGQIYNSAHAMGCAGDFIFNIITAEEARSEILANKSKLPVNIRMEDGVSWLHFDTFDPGRDIKVYNFKA